MGKIKTLIHLFCYDREKIKIAAFSNMINLGIFNRMSDEDFLKLDYRIRMGKELDLEHPKTYTEKVQWLKIHDRNEKYTQYVDKYKVRQHISDTIGDEYLIPLLGTWNHAKDIEWDKLPKQFVLKCNHDSGSVIICKDKNNFNYIDASKKLEKCLKKNTYYWAREWPYKNVKPCIVAEKYMEDTATAELRDYKFFCFDGEVKALFIAKDRSKDRETTFDFYDSNYEHLDISNGHPNALEQPEKPINFELMKQLASILSKGIPHVRVDFYECNGKVYFGELTFSHWSGMMPFTPEKWDKVFGDWITLPTM